MPGSLESRAVYVPDLASRWAPLPVLLLSVPALASAALAFQLPETRGGGAGVSRR